MFLLEPQKEPKRVPLLPIAREARLKGNGSRVARAALRAVSLKNPSADGLAPARGQHSTVELFTISISCCSFLVVRRGRRCGVAQRSMPQWGIEPHERASFAGWRPSFWPPSADAPQGCWPLYGRFVGRGLGPSLRDQWVRECRSEHCLPEVFCGSAGFLRASNARPYSLHMASVPLEGSQPSTYYFGPGGVKLSGGGKALRKMQHSCIF